jgi:hypothetical protein
VDIGIFTVFSNKEDGERDKQDGGINFFHWPITTNKTPGIFTER